MKIFEDSLLAMQKFLATNNEWFESYLKILIEKNSSLDIPSIFNRSEVEEKIFYYSFFYSLYKIQNNPTIYLQYILASEKPEIKTVRTIKSASIHTLIDDILLGIRFLLPVLYEKDMNWLFQVKKLVGENQNLKLSYYNISKLMDAKEYISKNESKRGNKRKYSLLEFIEKLSSIENYSRLSNIEIGKLLDISEGTVRNYKEELQQLGQSQ